MLLRSQPPWFPTGVATGRNGDLYILEYGFQPPSTWMQPRVRRVDVDGKVTFVAIAGQ